MKRLVFSFSIFLLSTFGSWALAVEITPFPSTNQSPFIQIFGLPGPGEAFILPPGQTEVSLEIIHSSNYATDITSREEIVIDGETTRLNFKARAGLMRQLEVGIKVPFVSHSGGFLDSFIDDYHRTFGLPRGGREDAPKNRLLYLYRRDGVDLFRLTDSSSGLGDISLLASWQLFQRQNERIKEGITLNLNLKLPTGESEKLMGSGSYDFAFSLTAQRNKTMPSGIWSLYGSLGALYLTLGDVLTEEQEKWVAFGSLGGGWAPNRWLSLKMQTDFHTPFYKHSDLDELSAFAVQLVLGGTVGITEKTALDIGITEDLRVKTSPDVVFFLNLRHRF